MNTKQLFMARWLYLTVLVCACAAGPSGEPSRGVPSTVAVLDYENLSLMNSAHADLSELLTAKAIETITNAGRYDVVERQHLATVLEELNLGSSMLADRQTQLKLGEITGAKLMVFGSYQLLADQLRLDIRLVDVQTGHVINAVSHMASKHNLNGWLDASAKSIAALLLN